MTKHRILINGAHGKMGTLTAKTLKTQADFIVVGELGRKDHLAEAIQATQAAIVIDFTDSASAFENTKTILQAGAHPVIGTSGLLPNQIQALQAIAADVKRGGIIAPNFSLGAVLLMKAAAMIHPYFPAVEIIEMHHDQKKDSPSGTAIRTAEMLTDVHTEGQDASPLPIHETLPHARGSRYAHIPIHSVRLPGLLAHEQVLFGGSGETLTLRHDTLDRSCYMPGVLLACRQCTTLEDLVVGLEHLI